VTFSQFVVAVKKGAFPEGYANNLASRHAGWIRDGLIDLQRYVPCMKYAHTSCFTQATSELTCGTTYINAPPGQVVSCEVLRTDDGCQVEMCRPVSDVYMRSLMKDFAEGSCRKEEDYEPFEDCSPYETEHPESDWRDRDQRRLYTRFDGKLWLFRSLRSNETMRIRWNGTKTYWANTDDIPWLDEAGSPSRVVQSAMEHWLLHHSHKYDDCDPQKAQSSWAAYLMARKEMVLDCRELNSVPFALEVSSIRGFYNQSGWGDAGAVCSAPIAYEGYEALRAVTGYANNQIFFLIYGDAPGDNWGGYFIFDAASADPESLPNVVKPNNIDAGSPGRFLRQQ